MWIVKQVIFRASIGQHIAQVMRKLFEKRADSKETRLAGQHSTSRVDRAGAVSRRVPTFTL
jgi:hypothetical protein